MQNFCEQRQRDHPAHRDETRSRSLDESPKRVYKDSKRETRDASRVISCAGWLRTRLTERRQKRVRVALGQELACAFGYLRADEDELGMQLPRLDVTVFLRHGFVERHGLATGGLWLPRDGAEPALECKPCFGGDSGHPKAFYRRRRSLT
jgi:hypothetical protein